MKLLISEVLQKAHNAKTKAEKIKILQQNNTPALRMIFIINYDESIVSLMPEGAPPFNKNEAPAGTEHTHLEHEARLLHHFFKGGSNLKPMKREQMFIQLLEGLHPDEADVIIKAKDKELARDTKSPGPLSLRHFLRFSGGGRS